MITKIVISIIIIHFFLFLINNLKITKNNPSFFKFIWYIIIYILFTSVSAIYFDIILNIKQIKIVLYLIIVFFTFFLHYILDTNESLILSKNITLLIMIILGILFTFLWQSF